MAEEESETANKHLEEIGLLIELLLVLGFMAYNIISRLSSKERIRDEKKLLRQLKKENAELLRRSSRKAKTG